MTKTYEVDDSTSEDDDEMLEFDPEVVENLNWWQRCFVPKYPVNQCLSGEEECSESRISVQTQQRGNKVEQLEESRDRFNSEDVTVQTNLTTPPGTPDVNMAISLPLTSCRDNNLPHNQSHSSGLETPSMRNTISAIDEEESEVDKSSEDDKGNDR